MANGLLTFGATGTAAGSVMIYNGMTTMGQPAIEYYDATLYQSANPENIFPSDQYVGTDPVITIDFSKRRSEGEGVGQPVSDTSPSSSAARGGGANFIPKIFSYILGTDITSKLEEGISRLVELIQLGASSVENPWNIDWKSDLIKKAPLPWEIPADDTSVPQHETQIELPPPDIDPDAFPESEFKYEAAGKKDDAGKVKAAWKEHDAKIGKDSQNALAEFGKLYPELGRGFLKHARALHPKQIIFPSAMIDPANSELAKKIGTDREFVASLIQDGVLDLRKAGLKTKLGKINLEEEFENYKLFQKLRKIFEGESLEAIKNDPELRDLALFQALWRVRVAVYKAQYVNAIVRSGSVDNEKMTEIYNEAVSSLAYAKSYLEDLFENFPFGTTTNQQMYKEKVDIALMNLRGGYLSRVDATLESLTRRLEEDYTRLETSRLTHERKRGQKGSSLPLDESKMERHAKKRYLIDISPNGTWIIPQGGFKTAGPTQRREIIPHHVVEEDVVRRMQHEIDGATKEFWENEHARETLVDLAQKFGNGGADLTQALEVLAATFVAYEKGVVKPKVKLTLLIDVALDLTKVAVLIDGVPEMADARRRLMNFTASMVNLAARQLEIRNTELKSQLGFMIVKKKVEEAVMAEKIFRDANIRIAAEAVSQGMKNDMAANMPEELDRLRKMAISAYRLIQKGELEAGLKKAKKELADILIQLRQMSERAARKSVVLNDIKDLTAKWEIVVADMKAGKRYFKDGKEVTFNDMRGRFLERIGEKVKSLQKLNSKLLEHQLSILYSAELVSHFVANKYSADEPGEEVLQKLAETKQQIVSRQVQASIQGPEHEPIPLGSVSEIDIQQLGKAVVRVSAEPQTEMKVIELVSDVSDLLLRAKKLGVFTDDRILLICPSCGLQEGVSEEGMLIVTNASNRGVDTGLRFTKVDPEGKKHRCPACNTKFVAPKKDVN